uniref:Uncharacterized protein n=1 Tax=Anguilla anguilla TaxID=7936 RepID=A0A0E9W7K2_ANGAN
MFITCNKVIECEDKSKSRVDLQASGCLSFQSVTELALYSNKIIIIQENKWWKRSKRSVSCRLDIGILMFLPVCGRH